MTNVDEGLYALASRAAEVHAQGGGFATTVLARRARRARRVHGTIVTAISATAVTTLVLAGATLVDREPPQPPAMSPTQSSTPSPSPDPGPTAEPARPVVLPSGDASIPFGGCGSLVGADPAAPPLADWGLSITAEAETLAAGEPLRLRTRYQLRDGAEATVSATTIVYPEHGPTIAVSQGGVVVAVEALFSDGASTLDIGTFSQLAEHFGGLELGVCSTGGGVETAGRALPPGDYQVQAWMPVTIVPGTGIDEGYWNGSRAVEELLTAPGAVTLTALSDPLPVTITGAAELPLALPDPDSTMVFPEPVAWPACGSPAPMPSDGDGLFRLDYDRTPLTLTTGAALTLGLATTYLGPGRLEAMPSPIVEFFAVQDGVVVGGVQWDTSGPGAHVRHGSSLHPYAGAILARCDSPLLTVPLGEGSYSLYPAHTVSMIAVTLSDGTVISNDQRESTYLWGEPLPLTIE